MFTGPQTLVMPQGLSDMRDAVRVTARGDFPALYQTEFDVMAGGLPWPNSRALKTEPVPGGFVMVPIRPLPPGPAEVIFPSVMAVNVAVPPVMGRQVIRFEPPVHWGWPGRAWGRLERWWGGTKDRPAVV